MLASRTRAGGQAPALNISARIQKSDGWRAVPGVAWACSRQRERAQRGMVWAPPPQSSCLLGHSGAGLPIVPDQEAAHEQLRRVADGLLERQQRAAQLPDPGPGGQMGRIRRSRAALRSRTAPAGKQIDSRRKETVERSFVEGEELFGLRWARRCQFTEK